MTDSQSLIERVARALAPKAWATLGSADTLSNRHRRVASLRQARAAISAMLEPTEAQISGGARFHDYWAGEGTVGASNARRNASAIYRAMIQAALSEGDP